MTLYEIDKEIQALITEDGEIADYEQFEALNMERDRKIENVGCWVKNLTAEAKAIREEEKALAERRRAAENKADRLKSYLDNALAGNSFTSPRVAIGYRTSKAVEIADESVFLAWAQLHAPELVRTTLAVDKTAVKDYIAGGGEVPCAAYVERKNIQVK